MLQRREGINVPAANICTYVCSNYKLSIDEEQRAFTAALPHKQIIRITY